MVHHQAAVPRQKINDVFSHVFFELFNANDIIHVIEDREWIPRKSLLKSLQRRAASNAIPFFSHHSFASQDMGKVLAMGTLMVPPQMDGEYVRSDR